MLLILTLALSEVWDFGFWYNEDAAESSRLLMYDVENREPGFRKPERLIAALQGVMKIPN